ncbi:unnamed protein product [Nesidiocoris tenuis]|uniref:P53 and DNA damage-regulated protein n=2 Tax=Nesidiocoris tenuis TaxID=355587 RepID=A0ABN7A999_9HEMI|nr:p53 and DNA damage-regulated protein [Nesidiocoris tenuis]CAA9997865.1 unnamed protein product [Nesidiocoris tenuis]
MENPVNGIQELTQIERLAAEIIQDKSEIVALDKRRQSSREGYRALVNAGKQTTNKSSWMAVGPVLLKVRSDKAKSLLEKDQKSADAEVNKLRSELKVKVNKLQDLEYKDPIPGLSLKPLSSSEFSAVRQVYGEHA